MRSLSRPFQKFSFPIPENLAGPYHSYLHDLYDRRLTVGFFFSIFLIPGAVVFDILVFPGVWGRLFTVRVVSTALCLVVFGLNSRTRLKDMPSFMCHVLNVLVSSTIVYLAFLTGRYESPYYAGLILIFIFLALVFPWGMKDSLLAGLITLSIHYSFNLFPSVLAGESINGSLVWNSFYFLTFSLVMVVIAAAISDNSRRRLFVATEEEKIRSRTLAESKERIDTLLKSRSRFISNITHELKTPLSIVIGNTELIARDSGCLDEEVERQLRVIRRAAFQLSGHVDRIIAVSSTEDPEYKLITEPFNYTGIVRNAYSLFEGTAAEQQVSFTLNVPEEPLIAALDVVAIEEVLNNLLQNAFKFTPSGGNVTLTIGTDGMEIFTEVADTGSGIPVGKIDKVFDRLYQVDDDLSKRHEGIGIGLFLVKRNVENHGGYIGVRSEEGKGSVFRFTLPLHVDQTVPVRNEEAGGSDRRNRPSRRRGVDRRLDERRAGLEYKKILGIDDLAQTAYVGNLAELENRNPARPSILLVEDNPGMMKVTADALFDDYNLFMAKDAFEALDKLHDHYKIVSLILSDVMMPGMDGFAFCGRVMADERYVHIPIIFVTALMDEKEQLTGYRAGATDYIVKPYNMRILKEKIAHWIARRQYETLLKEMSASVEPQLEELTRYKDIVVHEINNPMQVISIADAALQGLSALSYADAPKKDEEIQRFVTQIHEGVESIKSILDTSLDLQRGQLPVMQKEPLDVILDEAVAQSQHLLSRVRRVSVDTGPARGVKVACIPRMLVRAFVNIISNAAEAISSGESGPGGAVSLGVDLSESGWVSVRIEDDGIGIAPEERVNLFKFRYTTKQDGTGVGLHVVKTILKLHEGSIGVDSNPGSGSLFTVRLPVAAGEEA